MDDDTLGELDPKFLLPTLKMIAAYMEDIYREEVGDDLAEKFKKEIIEYGKDVYRDYQTTLQEAHKKLPEQHARRLDRLLQEINKLNPYKNEPTSLDPCSWMDIFKSIPVYLLMDSIANSIIRHSKGDKIKKIPNVLEYLSKPEVYKALLSTYIIKFSTAMGKYRDQLSHENLNQIKYLKASNDTQKYMETIQNYVQEVIKAITSTLQDTSGYIEYIIDELFYIDENEFDKKIEYALLDAVLELRTYDKLSKYS
jgi:gas vesicle protein